MGNVLLSYALAAVLITGMAGYAAARLRRFLVAQWFLRAAWQWLSGWRKDGRPGRGQRAAARSGGTVAAVGLAWSWMVNPQATRWGIVFLSLFLCIFATWQAVLAAVSWRHRRVWLRPLHLRLAKAAGIPPAARPQSWLEAARDRSWAVLSLPASFAADEKERAAFVATAAAALGMESPDKSWHLAGPKPSLTLTVSPPPPAAVGAAQIRPAIEAARPDEVVCGLGKVSAPVVIDLDGDSAQVGLTMGSGGGKSVTSRLILAQRLFKGDIGLVLDTKRISHTWARDLPNTAYRRDAGEIHDALLWLAAEGDRRNRVADAAADIEGHVHANVGPRIIVIAEELNTLMKRLRAYWLRERRPGDPPRSPALDALDEVLCMGRQVRINVVMIGQRLSDKATGGGGDARENLAALIFARFKPSTWKMLVPDLPMPPRTTHKLRAEVVTDVVRATQVALLTGREARDLALAGVVTPLPPGMPGAPRVTGYGHEAIPGPGLGGVTSQPGISPPPVMSLVTVREAIREGVLPPGTTPEAVKQAKWRDSRRPEGERVFPAHRGLRGLAKLYDPVELADWDAGRR